jgi:hypothetical protein
MLERAETIPWLRCFPMSIVVWCPQCKAPLTAEESTAGACTICGAALNAVTHGAPAPAVKSASAPPVWTRWQMWATGAILAAILFCVVIAKWPNSPPEDGHEARNHDDRNKLNVTPAPQPEKPTPRELMGPPESLKNDEAAEPPKKSEIFGPPISLKKPDIFGPPEALKGVPVAAKKPEIFGPPANLKPLPAVKAPGNAGGEIKLDDPDGEYYVELLSNKTLKLNGRVQRLRIGEIKDRGVLDASQLEANQVIIERGIRNDATVKLNAPGGHVEVRGPLNERGKLFVVAPDGGVTFTEKCEVNNQSNVTLTARRVEFLGKVQGWNTQVTMTITAGGGLRFRELNNGAKMQYKKANPKDPDVDVSGGDVIGQAEFRRVN